MIMSYTNRNRKNIFYEDSSPKSENKKRSLTLAAALGTRVAAVGAGAACATLSAATW